MILCVGLVEALGVDEAESVQAGVQRGGAVGLIGHQSVVAVAHPAVHLHTRRSINMDVVYRCGPGNVI